MSDDIIPHFDFSPVRSEMTSNNLNLCILKHHSDIHNVLFDF